MTKYNCCTPNCIDFAMDEGRGYCEECEQERFCQMPFCDNDTPDGAKYCEECDINQDLTAQDIKEDNAQRYRDLMATRGGLI